MINPDCAQEDVKNALHRLARMGIFGMYGGRKGHGFWLYALGIEKASSLLDNWNPADCPECPALTKAHGKSGNPYFWTWDEAMELTAHLDEPYLKEGV